MSAKYLIRLDDACDTLCKKNWNSIEQILDKFKIKPVVGVIPENLDNSLNYESKDKNFWKKVKLWEQKGWTIALHGFNHLFHKVDKKKLIFPYYDYSEFAGLKKNFQSNLLKKACKKFLKHNITPKVWVAPRHTFDQSTLEALKISTDIRIVSDGIALYPYQYNDFTFVPQQLWWPKKCYFGVWTICLHPNNMDKYSIKRFEQSLIKDNLYKSFISLKNILHYKRNKSFFDKSFETIFFLFRNYKNRTKFIFEKKFRRKKNIRKLY